MGIRVLSALLSLAVPVSAGDAVVQAVHLRITAHTHAGSNTYNFRDLQRLRAKESGDKKAAYDKQYGKYNDKLTAAKAAAAKAAEAAVNGRILRNTTSSPHHLMTCSRGV